MPYTILDIADKENVTIEEIRVPFQKNEYIDSLMKSEQYVEANVWSKLIVKELRTCREHVSFFIKFAEEYATEIGDSRRPFSVSTWEKAFEIWEESNI